MGRKQEPTTLWSIISDDSRRALVQAHKVAKAREAQERIAQAQEALTNSVASNTELVSWVDRETMNLVIGTRAEYEASR